MDYYADQGSDGRNTFSRHGLSGESLCRVDNAYAAVFLKAVSYQVLVPVEIVHKYHL
jgi:hypothetical protein